MKFVKIGITCGWREEDCRHVLHDDYIKAVEAAGGFPYILPACGVEKAEMVYEAMDALVFSGGGDVDPLYFGEEPLKGLGSICPKRDSFELALAKLALLGQKPVLAICRGAQILNIAAGGDIYQDLLEVTSQQHIQNAPRWYPTQTVEIKEHSKLALLTAQRIVRVNSFHHQAIRKLGTGLQAVAWSRDGLVEAVELQNSVKTVMGVQWHPENMWRQDQLSHSLFIQLVLEAAGKQ